MEELKYPRLYVSNAVLKRVKRYAKKQGVSLKKISDKVAIAGLRSLGA